MKVLLVDPSLFTEPYDAALSSGLEANGVTPIWATRAARDNEQINLPMGRTKPIFYPLSDGPRRTSAWSFKWLKGIEHLGGLFKLWQLSKTERVNLVHVQWTTLPGFDRIIVKLLRRKVPVVLTIHDITPFNGVNVNPLQLRGLDEFMHCADHLIVHTEHASAFLKERGMAVDKISVVAHGPLPLRCVPQPVVRVSGRTRLGRRLINAEPKPH